MKININTILATTAVSTVGLLSVMVINTFLATSKQITVPVVEKTQVNSSLVAEHFSNALKYKTISDPAFFNGEIFTQFHQFLEDTYPLTHKLLKREVVNDYSLLYTWQGTDKNLKPMQLMGHFDAAPTEKGVDKQWTHAPFSGAISDGYVWGRGAMHSKLNVITILESVELLLAQGYTPTRTIYLAFGHDDDILGEQGAKKIGELLESRGVELEYVLEEAGMILDGIIDGVSQPVAQVAVAEKGYLTIELTTQGEGGHSSMVPKKTAIGVLSQAIYRLESHQFPARISGASEMMLSYLAPEMPFSKRFALANLWLLESIVSEKFAQKAATNALVRTTLAVTVVDGGVKDNLLPVHARAVANIRMIPGDDVQSVLKTITQVIDDPRVAMKVKGHLAVDSQTMLSQPSSFGYKSIEKTLRQLYPNMIVAPSQLTAITDIRNYKNLSNNLYRFQPSWIRSTQDTKRLHGVDERTSVKNLSESVQFYVQLIKNSTI